MLCSILFVKLPFPDSTNFYLPSLLAWLPAPPGGGRACPPALFAPSPRLSEMAGPLGRGTRNAAPCGCRGALRSVRWGSNWSSAGKRSESGGGAERTAPGLLWGCEGPGRGSPSWIRSAGPVGTGFGASAPRAPCPASSRRLALPAEVRGLLQSGPRGGRSGSRRGAARPGNRGAERPPPPRRCCRPGCCSARLVAC